MLINVKSVKLLIKLAGLRSKAEVVFAIDKKVNDLISAIIAKAKEKKIKTLRQEDIL